MEKQNKRTAVVYLVAVLLFVLLPQVLYMICPYILESLAGNCIISGAIVALPAIAAVYLWRHEYKAGELLPFHAIGFGTILKIALFTAVISPLPSFFNILSQLFFENEISGTMTEMLQYPFIVTFLLVAVYAPLCEETLCRGILYHGFRKQSGKWKAMFASALAFGLLHMNYNQAIYAFVVGMIMVLLVEATGSLWGSVFYHIFFNGFSVCLLYSTKLLLGDSLEMELENTQVIEPSESRIMLLAMAAFFGILSIGAIVLGTLVYIWIAKGENRMEHVKALYLERKEKTPRVFTLPFILAILVCLVMMTLRAVQVI